MSGVFENAIDLVARHAREPLQKLGEGGPSLKIREECGDRHTRTAKNPRATHASRVVALLLHM